MATMDERMADYAVAYIKEHAKSGKPFFMDINWIKMHNPTNAAPDFRGKLRPYRHVTGRGGSIRRTRREAA
jgi:arylsulfatase